MPFFKQALISFKTHNANLIKLKGQLVDLESAWKILENVRTTRITQGIPIADITNQINENERLQKLKKNEIANKQKDIDRVNASLTSINQSVQFKNIISANLLKELDHFINSGTYQNENFAVTKNMTPMEIQDMEMQLYERGKTALKKMSQPNYTFNMDVVAFPFLKKYKNFINQIRLGSTVNAEVQNRIWIEPVLLKMDIPYDNPKEFKMYFSNKLRLTDAEWTLEELQNQSANTNNKVSYDGSIWGEPVKSGLLDEVSKYMSDSLNLVNQSIQNADSQDFLINQFGLIARKSNPDGSFSKEQFRLVNNLMAYTDDAWQSVKSAFGKIKSPYDNSYLYGLIAPAVVGNLIAGNQLLITNENNYFRVDGAGATLYNAFLKLLKKDNLAQILLDPNNGIKIQTKSGDNWIDSFYTNLEGKIVANDIITERGTIGGFEILSDRLRTTRIVSQWHGFDRLVDLRADGIGRLGFLAWDLNNAWFDGSIYAKGGTIGGFEIGSNYIKSLNSNIRLNDNGTGKISLLTWDSNNAWFDGDIWARNLKDYVTNNNIKDDSLRGDKLSSNSLKGSKISNQSVPHSKVDGEFDNIVANTIKAKKIFAEYGEFNTLKANVASINSLVATKASVEQLKAITANIDWL